LVKDRAALTVLAETPFPVALDRPYRVSLTVEGNRVRGEIDGERVADKVDDEEPLLSGGVGLNVTEGALASGAVRIAPL
jgi:hypothetical protein